MTKELVILKSIVTQTLHVRGIVPHVWLECDSLCRVTMAGLTRRDLVMLDVTGAGRTPLPIWKYVSVHWGLGASRSSGWRGASRTSAATASAAMTFATTRPPSLPLPLPCPR